MKPIAVLYGAKLTEFIFRSSAGLFGWQAATGYVGHPLSAQLASGSGPARL